MLLLHETHRVTGVHEDAFADAFREGWMPALAAGDDARLLFFGHQAHGTGRAYVVVTVTGVRDGSAWERLARRVECGDLRPWAERVDGYRHDVRGKILMPVDWSPGLVEDWAAVPVDGREHPPGLFMEDTAWPHEGMLSRYLEAARDHYAPSLTEGRHGGRALLELQAVLRPAWGTGRRREVILWQKVVDPSRLTALLGSEIPAVHRTPGTWMHDALAVRDDWESRLLRSASWSPLA